MNDLTFVKGIIELLSRAGITVWLFGGWAEELSGLAQPREHHDVDLLFPAEGFEQVDVFILRQGLAEIVDKHMPHKRAVLVDDILVEIFLVQRDQNGYYTVFFDERWDWPSDIFFSASGRLPIASRSSLVSFRSGWGHRRHLNEHL